MGRAECWRPPPVGQSRHPNGRSSARGRGRCQRRSSVEWILVNDWKSDAEPHPLPVARREHHVVGRCPEFASSAVRAAQSRPASCSGQRDRACRVTRGAVRRPVRTALSEGPPAAATYAAAFVNALRVACTTLAASTPKNARSAARVSLRPKPSVPSVRNERPTGRNARTLSGTART